MESDQKPLSLDSDTPPTTTNPFVPLSTPPPVSMRNYLIIALVSLVLVAYTGPIAFFALAPYIGFFIYLYPAGLIAAAVWVFRKVIKIKPRHGTVIVTLAISVASIALAGILTLLSIFAIIPMIWP
ncbi:hypothetical protein FWF89_03935 [Candidatus Saccharibacteria bacterium]|nr:hypothetical protein [Candidatus Saccharibacteria bacterium]